MGIQTKYDERVEAVNSLLCVGLDSNIERIPQRFLSTETPQFAFNRWIIEQTHTYVSAYKPNIAFYEARGVRGWHELQLTMDYLREYHADIFTICDAKRGDIGSTNASYAKAIFDDLGFDAVTLQSYVGYDALQPFLAREDKACIILCRMSNSGAGEFQDLGFDGKPLWQIVAEQVRDVWNTHQNCMLVMGATAVEQLATARHIAGEMTFLVPGIGAQGGSVSEVMAVGLNAQKRGLILNASRSVIFADEPATVCETLRDDINPYR